MTVRIAINGLGRIGRCVLRAITEYDRNDIELVAVNGPAPIETHLHLLKYDSTHGIFPQIKKIDDTTINAGKNNIKLFRERDPEKLPWGDLDIDIVLECTGHFRNKEEASAHIKAGAKKVIISAPADGVDSTIVCGVNEYDLKQDHTVISIGSCTTNCLAPIVKILDETIGIQSGFMTTIHAFTNDQNILDGTHKDLRRARTASSSMIPTSTGAAKALGLVLPSMKGKLDGVSVRVPTPNVSMVDLVISANKPTSIEQINNAMKTAANGTMSNILGYSDEPLVSIDYCHNPHSSIFDATGTKIVGNNLVRVAAWYDNEWGFSVRMLDAANILSKI